MVNDLRATDRSQREAAFFDHIGDQQTETWWGHLTPAGRTRARRRAELVLEGTRLRPGQRGLELGCGAGFFATNYWDLLPDQVSVTAVDISERLIALADKRPELTKCSAIEFVVANAERIDYPDGHFDAVFGSSILHHLQLDVVLPEVLRVLRSGGRFSFAEPNMANPDVYLARHVEFYRKRTQMSEDETAFYRFQARRLLGEVGLIEVDVQPFDFLHPLTPAVMVGPVRSMGRLLEKIPGIREFAGSLILRGIKPTASSGITDG